MNFDPKKGISAPRRAIKTIAQASAWVKFSIGNRPEAEEPSPLSIVVRLAAPLIYGDPDEILPLERSAIRESNQNSSEKSMDNLKIPYYLYLQFLS